MSTTVREIESQPAVWAKAVELVPEISSKLPARGQRIAVTGCGTSHYMAQAVAAIREGRGWGESDAFAAS